MNDDQTPATEARGRGLPLTRLEAFSDGVFAIAITLLVLEIAVPLGAEEDLVSALLALWPAYLAYVVSFLTIGWVWIGHSAITSHLERSDGLFLRLNLLLLLAVAFLPFPTALMGEYFGVSEPERIAVVFYGVVLIVIALLIEVLWRYARGAHELRRPDLAGDELAGLMGKSTPGLVLLVASTAVGIVVPSIGVLCFLVVSAYLVVPFRAIRDVLARPGR
jgi:uncharacterized membrane protein